MPYAVSLKVQLSQHEGIYIGEDESLELMLGEKLASIEIQEHGFRLKAKDFDSEDDAKVFALELSYAVRLWAAELGAAASVASDIKQPYIFEDPKDDASRYLLTDFEGFRDELDGHFNEADSVVYDQHLRLLSCGGSGNFGSSSPASKLKSCLGKAMSTDIKSAFEENSYLSSALDLIIAAHSEISPRARLFGYLSALECLASPLLGERPSYVQSVIDASIELAKNAISNAPGHEQDYESLIRNFEQTRRISIASSIRRLLKNHLPLETPFGPRKKVIQEIWDAHGEIRGKLIHGSGHPDTIGVNLHEINALLKWTVTLILFQLTGLNCDSLYFPGVSSTE